MKWSVFLRILFFWDVTQYHWVCRSWHVKGVHCFYCHGSHGPKDWNSLLHHCENLRAHKEVLFWCNLPSKWLLSSCMCFWFVPVIVHIQTVFTPWHLMSELCRKCTMPGTDDGRVLASLCSPRLNSSLINNTIYSLQHNLYGVYCVVYLLAPAQQDGSC
jgi:hypothetical protein